MSSVRPRSAQGPSRREPGGPKGSPPASFDDEASPAEQSPLQNAIAQYESWLGYWDTSAVLTDGGREYVYGASTRPANHNDWPVALKLVDRLLAAGDRPGAVDADRGFTGGRRWVDTLRERCLHPVFDFKQDQAKRDPDWRGCLVLQGWPYLPQLPQRLWHLVAPAVGERKEGEGKRRWEQFCRDVEEREQYALVAHGQPTPTKARVSSPLFRGRKLGCPKVPSSMRGRAPNSPCARATMATTRPVVSRPARLRPSTHQWATSTRRGEPSSGASGTPGGRGWSGATTCSRARTSSA